MAFQFILKVFDWVEVRALCRPVKGPPEWRSYRSEAWVQTWVHSRAVPQPAVDGSPIGRHTISLASYRLGEGLDRGLYLANHAIMTPCGGLGACRLTSVTS